MADIIQGLFFHDFANSHIPEILQETYLDKIYDTFLKDRKQVIVDIGANIGLTSYYFKDFANIVYSVEPARVHIDSITTMVNFNKIKNIVILPYAVSADNGPKYLYHNPNLTMYGLDSRLSMNGDFEIVMGLSMDALMDMFKIPKIDFLKLDPEGAESEILLSEGFKNKCIDIKSIVGEWHEWTKLNKDEFRQEYVKLGYDFKWISEVKAQLYSAVRPL